MRRVALAFRTSPWHIRRWLIGFVLMILWAGVSLGWSWFLITSAFDSEMRSRIVAAAQGLSEQAQSVSFNTILQTFGAISGPAEQATYLEAARHGVGEKYLHDWYGSLSQVVRAF